MRHKLKRIDKIADTNTTSVLVASLSYIEFGIKTFFLLQDFKQIFLINSLKSLLKIKLKHVSIMFAWQSNNFSATRYASNEEYEYEMILCFKLIHYDFLVLLRVPWD